MILFGEQDGYIQGSGNVRCVIAPNCYILCIKPLVSASASAKLYVEGHNVFLSCAIQISIILMSSLPYCPPDLNKNMSEIFGKLVNIYRALGDDRRSSSYYKAISVIEKLPFKIESCGPDEKPPVNWKINEGSYLPLLKCQLSIVGSRR